MAGIGPIRQDWEPVVVRKKAPTAAAKKDEKAVNAARRSGAEIETMKKCAYYCLPHLLLPFSFDLIRFAFPSPFLWIEGVLFFFLGAIFLLDLIDPCRSGAEGIDRFGLGSSFLFSVDFFLGYRFLGLLLMDSFWEKRFRFFFWAELMSDFEGFVRSICCSKILLLFWSSLKYWFFLFDLCTDNAGTNKAASSGTSLNTKRLDDDTESLARESSSSPYHLIC